VRSQGEHTGQRGQMLLAAGELPGLGIGDVGDVEVVQHRLGAFPPVLAPEVEGTEGDVVTRGRPHDLVAEVLEHVADVPGDLADGAMGRAAAVAPDRARDVAVPEVRDEPVEGLAQRRLARTVPADDGDEVPRSMRRSTPRRDSTGLPG